jgi:hypothetical protein
MPKVNHKGYSLALRRRSWVKNVNRKDVWKNEIRKRSWTNKNLTFEFLTKLLYQIRIAHAKIANLIIKFCFKANK